MKPYYQQNGITIYHGNYQEILPSLPLVDLVLTDPPYADIETHGNHLSTIVPRKSLGFSGITSENYCALVRCLLLQCKRWVITTADFRHVVAAESLGLPLIRFGIWRKPNGSPQFTGDRPGMGWEAIGIFHGTGRKRWNGGGKHAVWTYNIESGLHPTQKPLGLFSELVQDFSDPFDLVLDPFMGSGTSCVAAKELERKAIGIEIEERYCEIAARRCEITQPALFTAPRERPEQPAIFTEISA